MIRRPLACLLLLGLLSAGIVAAHRVPAAAATTPSQGVDVSYWQGPAIDWASAAGAGISFAYIRAAEGSTYSDPYLASNWAGAQAAGITPGAYLFFHPSEDPNAQAALFIGLLRSVGFGAGDLVPALDVETTDNEPPATVAGNLLVVVNDIENAFGVAPAIYASPIWWNDNVASSAFVGDPLWLADWTSGSPSLPADGWGGNGDQAWQYTSSGSVPGIPGSIDLDAGNPGPPVYHGPAAPVHGVALRADGKAGYTLDGYGGVHPFGGAPAVSLTGYWPGWDIARAMVLRPDGMSGYVLDGWGGIHPFGGAPPVSVSGYWPGWDIARAMVLRPDGVSGYVLDAWGGIHPFGGAPSVAVSAYWRGWDIARAMVLRPDGISGYVLDGWGGVHPFGGAPPVSYSAYWPGWDIARGIVLAGGGTSLAYPANSGYVLDGWGGVHPFGGAPPVSYTATSYYPGWDIARGIAFAPSVDTGAVATDELDGAFTAAIAPGRAVAMRSDGNGGYLLDGFGGITPFGGATAVAGAEIWPAWDIARGIALRADNVSGYILDGWGGIHPFGGAPPVTGGPYSYGEDVARAILLRADGASGYVLDEHGGLSPFGGAPAVAVSQTWGGDVARAAVLLPGGVSGYVLDDHGGLHPFGGAPSISTGLAWSSDMARGVALLTPTSGYVLDDSGGIHAFGGAPPVAGAGSWPGDDVGRGIALVAGAAGGTVNGVVATSTGVVSPFSG